MSLIYGLQIIGLLYTSNLQTGFFILEKKLSLILIPLIVLPVVLKFDPDLKALFKKLGIITILSSVVLIILAGIKSLFLHDPRAFYFEEVTSIHYVYYSIYFACGSLILIDSVFESSHQRKTLVIILLFAYSLCVLVLVASKTGMMAFGAAAVVVLYRRIENRKIFAVALIMMALLSTVFLYFNETTRNRFVGLDEHLSILKLDDFRGKEVHITDLNMRLLFWKISVSNLWKENAILTGVGTGDAQDFIDALYVLPQYDLRGYIGWDSHNQWVYTLIQLGIIGFAAMALLYGRYFLLAWKKNNLAFLSFLIITSLFTLSESILESNKGIVFVALLFTLFCASCERKGEAI